MIKIIRLFPEVRRYSSEGLHLGGQRFLTFMIYLSDVEAGGRTVFTQTGVTVRPRTGNALFWFNLHSDGDSDGDYDSKVYHLGCPVAYGNKWIANKWVKGQAQMLGNYPCSSAKGSHFTSA